MSFNNPFKANRLSVDIVEVTTSTTGDSGYKTPVKGIRVVSIVVVSKRR